MWAGLERDQTTENPTLVSTVEGKNKLIKNKRSGRRSCVMGWKETEALSDETDGGDGESPIARGEMEKASDGEREVGRR